MKRFFGSLPDGAPTHVFTLDSRGGLRADILDYGGILRSLTFPGRRGRTSLVLGFDNIDAYVRDTAYVGVIAGRYANRIAGAQFSLEGKRWKLSANEGPNHLHGGSLGLGKRVWRMLDCEDGIQPRLRLGLPLTRRRGRVSRQSRHQRRVRAERGDELTVSFEARCDAATPVNLTYHPYFDLSGDRAAPLADQWLTVSADRFLPISNSLIPTGEIAPVADTPFDFRRGRTLATAAGEDNGQLAIAGGYDHCLVPASDAQFAAELYSELSGIRMQISSSLPAIQVYDGHLLTRQHPTLGRGICLEPQEYPNAPNEPRFPSCNPPAGPALTAQHPISVLERHMAMTGSDRAQELRMSMAADATVECIWPLQAQLGEGPIWLAREQCVWFVDIEARRIHRTSADRTADRTWTVPQDIGFIVPAADGGYICGLRSGLHRFDPQTRVRSPC